MKTNDIDVHMDTKVLNDLDKCISDNQNSDWRITKKLLVNMGLLFLIKEQTAIDIKAQIKEYPTATKRKRIALKWAIPVPSNYSMYFAKQHLFRAALP